MIPLKSLIQLDKTCHVPIYLQITQSVIQEIQNGILKPGTKLPGSRITAELLKVHRKTIVKAFEELEAQGWIEIIPYKGTFIAQHLPQVKARPLVFNSKSNKTSSTHHLNIPDHPALKMPSTDRYKLGFDDGCPDVRLAPINELAKSYASILRKATSKELLGYQNTFGLEQLREVLAVELNKTRGLNITAKNILISRGSQMGIYLVAATLLQKGDCVIVGETNYNTSNITFDYLGTRLLRVPVDACGIVVEAVEQLCQQKKIKAIYITSHHHHPTTVTLSPERRIRLLALAERYRFAIIEDDYDYEFHYSNSPILPLASGDQHGLVSYIGSFSKSTAPTFRIGYIVASEFLILEFAKLRRILDRQGDMVLEAAFAELLATGVIRRYLKKALKQYRERRDLCVQLLNEKLSDHLTFKIPDGGMAIWAEFDKKINLPTLSQLALQNGFHLSDGLSYDPPGKKLNACRMGFASRNPAEIRKTVDLLHTTISQLLANKK